MSTADVVDISARLNRELARVDAPKPGIYRGVSFPVYSSWPALRYSVLHHVRRSPAHAHHVESYPEAQTDAMRLGSALHTMVLEPFLFGKRFAARPVDADGEPVKLTTKAGRDWAASLPPEVDILAADEPAHVQGMVQALHAHPTARQLLFDSKGANEVCLVWDEDGLLCKRRLDRMAQVTLPNGIPCESHGDDVRCPSCSWSGTAIVELKTARDARTWGFAAQAEALGYFNAAWWSLRGAEVLSRPRDRRYLFVVVETVPPYAVAVHEPDQADIEAAGAEVRQLLEMYRRCQLAGTWPAYDEGIQLLRRPGYARARREEEEAI